ncbi:MAG: DUF4349 domain-containing protein [bacterium]|nr:DUF4349 domain-containing protein [bacterium]
MNKKFKKGILIYATGFIVLFIFRIIYGYVVYPSKTEPGLETPYSELVVSNKSTQEVFQGHGWNPEGPAETDGNTLPGYVASDSQYTNYSNLSNYASSKLSYKTKEGTGSQTITIDQKYERIANIASLSTKDFDKDEEECRSKIKKYNALIQFEGRVGLEGKRRLVLGIGVDPDKFDVMVKEIEKIGEILSKKITKTDKTNEYKDLNAKKKSLFKTRDSLIALKRKGGKIDEFIKLENRILDIEDQIQKLGVRLGEYDSEKELCTIKFSLSESNAAASIPLLHRIKIAFEWTIIYYFILTLIAIFGGLLILLVIHLMEKLNWIAKIIKKFE